MTRLTIRIDFDGGRQVGHGKIRLLELIGDARIVCVHGAYLYGPGGSDRAEREERERNERIALERRIAAMPGSSSISTDYPGPSSGNTGPLSTLRDPPCKPGYGMKPAPPPSFGAWSCQPLGVIYLASDRQPASQQAKEAGQVPAAAPEPVQAFEQRAYEMAAAAVVSAAAASGPALPASDRETCKLAAFAAVYCTPDNGVVFEWRTRYRGAPRSVSMQVQGPCWLKLVRRGNSFAAYHSEDGRTWTRVGEAQTVVMPGGVRGGLAVTSHDVGRKTTARFTNVVVD